MGFSPPARLWRVAGSSWVLSRASQGRAHTAPPAQHPHSLGSSCTAKDPWAPSCCLELHSWASFPRMRLQALFPWWGTLQETAQLLVGAWGAGRIPVVALPLSEFQPLPWVWCLVQLCSSAQPLGPSGSFPPRLGVPKAQSEINSCPSSGPNNKTWDYNTQQRHLESSDPSRP